MRDNFQQFIEDLARPESKTREEVLSFVRKLDPHENLDYSVERFGYADIRVIAKEKYDTSLEDQYIITMESDSKQGNQILVAYRFPEVNDYLTPTGSYIERRKFLDLESFSIDNLFKAIDEIWNEQNEEEDDL